MKIKIRKCHGSGNDFVLIDEITNKYTFSEEERAKISASLSNRETGIGSDGVLFLQNSDKCDARMRMFNTDGSEAEMCGNGLRCIGRYAMELLGKDKITLQTMKAEYETVKAPELYENVPTIQIWLNSVNLNTKSLPMVYDKEHCFFETVPAVDENLKITAVSMTNPHIVTFIDKLDNTEITRLGEKVNNLKSVFPEGVNFNFVKEINEDSIYVRTYERGCAITKSCGTGMTASSVAFCLKHPDHYGKDINIYNDGGMIKINVSRNNDKYENKFTGNASYVFDANLTLDENYKLVNIDNRKEFTDEIEAYDKFFQVSREAI